MQHGEQITEPIFEECMAQLSYAGVRMVYPMTSPYERQLFAEHVTRCSKRHYQRVEVEIGDQRWTLHHAMVGRAECSRCGDTLHTFFEAPSGKRQLCVACAIEDSAAGTSSPPAQKRTS